MSRIARSGIEPIIRLVFTDQLGLGGAIIACAEHLTRLDGKGPWIEMVPENTEEKLYWIEWQDHRFRFVALPKGTYPDGYED